MSQSLVVNKIYSLSPMQEGMYYYFKVTDDPGMYFIQMRLTLCGTINTEIFEESVNRVVERYDILRTIFVNEGLQSPKQVVLKQRRLKIHYEELIQKNQSEQNSTINYYIQRDRAVKMDLLKDLLLRVAIFRTGNQCCEAVLSFHHIILDGWSVGIVIDDIIKTYEALLDKQEPSYEVVTPFQNYISWLEEECKKEESLLFWKQYLNGYEEKAVIQESWSNRDLISSNQKEEVFYLSEEFINSAKDICVNNKATLSSFIHTVWGIILFRYNQTDDVVFGTVTSGRNPNVKEVSKIVGMLINTVPIRITSKYEDTFIDLLTRVQSTILKVEGNSYIQLAEIMATSKLKKDLLNHIIAYENYFNQYDEDVNQDRDNTLKIRNCETLEQTNYNITIKFLPSDHNMKIKIMYNDQVYATDYIQQLGENISTLMQGIIYNPKIYVRDLSILNEEHKNTILYEFNKTEVTYSSEKLIHQLFEERAIQFANKSAVSSKTGSYTYQQLNQYSNQLARYLKESYVSAKEYVAVLLERSVSMVSAVISVLKAGAVYVPFEINCPPYRMAQIIDELSIKCVLTESSQKEKILKVKEQTHVLENIIFLDQISSKQYSVENLEPEITSTDQAYIIYTSGSTGNPKGVVVSHRPVINLIEWVNRQFDINSSDKLLFITSLCFDLSVYDIFGLLASGGEIYVVSEEEKSDQRTLLELICKNQITFWDSAPAAFQQLLPILPEYKQKVRTASLKRVFFSGDWIPITMPEIIREYIPQANVISLGGATEAVIWSNFFEIAQIDPKWVSIPYGYPIQNAYYYILDKQLRPTPIGVKGELYIGGECLASGYIKDPELTNNKFLKNPFLYGENQRIYKTGDLARWTNAGYMEFLGREDSQVKIRGYRIELGEIAYHMKQIEEIIDSVIHIKEDKYGSKYLIAYYISKQEIGYGRIKKYLLSKLPEYMIPSYFVQLEEFPVTKNGKLDRKALPDPEDSFSLGNGYTAPENEIQNKLVKLWAEILKLKQENISIDDDFFELGGHSLLAIQLEVELQKNGLQLKEGCGRGMIREITSIRNMSYCIKE